MLFRNFQNAMIFLYSIPIIWFSLYFCIFFHQTGGQSAMSQPQTGSRAALPHASAGQIQRSPGSGYPNPGVATS